MVSIAERMLTTAEKLVKKAVGREVPIRCEAIQETSETAMGDGAGLLIAGQTDTGLVLGGTGIAERGKPAETVAEEAASTFCNAVTSGACVDEWYAILTL